MPYVASSQARFVINQPKIELMGDSCDNNDECRAGSHKNSICNEIDIGFESTGYLQFANVCITGTVE